MRLETGLQRHVTGMLFPLASGSKFGSLNPKLLFFPVVGQRNLSLVGTIIMGGGERSRAGSSCLSCRETQQETPLRAAVLAPSTRVEAG